MNTRRADYGRSRRSPSRSRPGNPIYGFLFLALTLAFLLAATIWYMLPGVGLFSWLVAISIITIFVYRYDKAVAGSPRTRVPEVVLHLLTLTGGGLGAFTAMWLIRPRHKVQKLSFVLVFWLILLLHIALIVFYLNYFAPQP